MKHQAALAGRWGFLLLALISLAAFSACAAKPAIQESLVETLQTDTSAETTGNEDQQDSTGNNQPQLPQEERGEDVRKLTEIGMTKEAAEGLLVWIDWLHEQGKIDDPNIVYAGTATIQIGNTPTNYVVFMTADETTYYANMSMDYYPPYEIFKNVIADDCCIYWSGEYNPTS